MDDDAVVADAMVGRFAALDATALAALQTRRHFADEGHRVLDAVGHDLDQKSHGTSTSLTFWRAMRSAVTCARCSAVDLHGPALYSTSPIAPGRRPGQIPSGSGNSSWHTLHFICCTSFSTSPF